MSISELVTRALSELFAIPPVVDGNRLEINRRLKLILDRDGVPPTSSSWKDGTRVVPQERRRWKVIKGSKG